MRKIQIAIYLQICVSDWHEIWQAAAARNRLRGWSRMVLKQFQDGKQPPFWKSIYRHISVKNHPISMNFEHSSRFWTGWTWRDQKWKKLHWTDSVFDRTFFLFSVLSVCECMCVFQRNNSWSVWDIIVKFLWEQDMVNSWDEFDKELCCRRKAARCFVNVSSLLQQYNT